MEGILSAVLYAMVFVFALGCARADEGPARSLLDEHNRQRARRGLEPLVLDAGLCEYAQSHADKMARRGMLVHSSMSNLAVKAGNGNVGENVAWGQSSEEEVCDSWMKSSGHRANILSKRYKKAGFGVKEDERGRKYWCAVFSA
jgi:uncharacterized protein YkwD